MSQIVTGPLSTCKSSLQISGAPMCVWAVLIATACQVLSPHPHMYCVVSRKSRTNHKHMAKRSILLRSITPATQCPLMYSGRVRVVSGTSCMAFGNLKVVVKQGLTSASSISRFHKISKDIKRCVFSPLTRISAVYPSFISRSAFRKLGEVVRRAGNSGRHFGHWTKSLCLLPVYIKSFHISILSTKNTTD